MRARQDKNRTSRFGVARNDFSTFYCTGLQGNADGEHRYGLCLRYGRGVSQNYEEAARYFKLSADQGNALAQKDYGYALVKGLGVNQDYHEAAYYFRLSADQGNSDGQYL